MTVLRISLVLPLLALPVAAQSIPQQSSPEPNSPEPALAAAVPSDTPVVYVSDFDLDVVQRKPAPKPQTTRTSSRSKPSSTSGSTSRAVSGVPRTGASPASESTGLENTEANASESEKEETPAEQADTLVKAVSENLVRALTQAGFDAQRVSSNAALPKSGVRIRGVFAEADDMNRARRLLVGGEPVGPNIILYVGVNNLKSPEQPLYLLADPPAKDPRHGPVITVTSYSPAARYELSRDPSGEELQTVSKKIAADLRALIGANSLSLAQ
ncbi:MAG TPA: DUF4410 domain-containing protein [Candidatus Acidoferrum sp.]|nr:DUF4410 domain-containing protein [Candidatus Acidoferrum sp.]